MGKNKKNLQQWECFVKTKIESDEREGSDEGASDEDSGQDEEEEDQEDDEGEDENPGDVEASTKANPFPGPKLNQTQDLDTFAESLQQIQDVNFEISEMENQLGRMFVGFNQAEPYYKNKNFRSGSEKKFYDGYESGIPSQQKISKEQNYG